MVKSEIIESIIEKSFAFFFLFVLAVTAVIITYCSFQDKQEKRSHLKSGEVFLQVEGDSSLNGNALVYASANTSVAPIASISVADGKGSAYIPVAENPELHVEFPQNMVYPVQSFDISDFTQEGTFYRFSIKGNQVFQYKVNTEASWGFFDGNIFWFLISLTLTIGVLIVWGMVIYKDVRVYRATCKSEELVRLAEEEKAKQEAEEWASVVSEAKAKCVAAAAKKKVNG